MDLLLVGSCIVVVAVFLWLIRKYHDGGWCYSKARLDGKTVIITGANTGIGKETARDLARRGARIILACRDLTKAEAAAAEIRAETGNSDVVVRKLDLASLASVREFTEKIKSEESRLDILINNAGIMMCPEWQTEDGFEMQFGVNHLGHFLLTNLLLDLIKSSAPARILNLTSGAHQYGHMHWDDVQMRGSYDAMAAYMQSKLANVLFTRELSKRLKGTGVTVNAVHPGRVATQLNQYIWDTISFRMRIPFFLMVKNPISAALTLKTPVQGAQTTIQCAVAEELKDVTGLYFRDCAPRKPNPEALDDESARRLWELSAEMVGLEKKVE